MRKFKYKKSYFRVFSVFIALVMIVVSIPVTSLDASAADEDFSGIWLFNNVKYDKKYIHINNNNTMTGEGETIELHEYNKYWALRWYIISVGNGYYKIESVYSDKVLTAPTGYNNDIVTQTTYTGANTQQWRFIKQSDGSYKISPKSNSNCFLVAGPLYDKADQDLEIQSAQSDGTDKWNLIDINYQYHVAIRHYYDFGYIDRFFNVSSDIEDYQEVCSAILSELFNVKVSYSAKLFESSADLCAYDYSSVTSCATHKTRERLRSGMIFQYDIGNLTTARVIWTGHKLEESQSSYQSGSETIVMTIGMVTDSQNNYSNYSNSYIFNQRILTLLHETSHFLGALDHRCNKDPIFNCSNPGCYNCYVLSEQQGLCVMKDPILDWNTRLLNRNWVGIYCNYCMSSTNKHGIPKHLSEHH